MYLKRAPKKPSLITVSIDKATWDLYDDAPPEAQTEAQPEEQLEQKAIPTTNTQKTPKGTHADQVILHRMMNQ